MRNNVLPHSLNIVIVEDNPFIASRLSTMLIDEHHHHIMGTARSVSRAIVLIREKKPEVVILDIHLEQEMNGMNGIDLLKQLRMEYPEIEVMMLSNYSEPQYRRKCMQLGASHFFDKTSEFDKIPGALSVTTKGNLR
jgi:DNA-binding NarL/FixJ family response regulator